MIHPTIGRVVHFVPGADTSIPCAKGSCLAALITDVLSSNMVNLAVFDSIGHAYPCPGVALVQPEDIDKGNIPKGAYARWMSFQVGQTPGSQELIRRLEEMEARFAALELRLSGEVSPSLAGLAPSSPPAPPAPQPKSDKGKDK